MAGAITDKFTDTYNAQNPNVARVTGTRAASGATLTCDNLAGWPDSTTSGVHFSTYQIDTSGNYVSGSQIDWVGLKTSSTTIGSMTRVAGATDSGNSVGDYVEMNPTGTFGHYLFQGLTTEHNKDGTHAAITATSMTATGTVTAANFIQSGGANSAGWTVGLGAPNTVTALGNRSYSLVFNSVDLTSTLSAGMRLKTTRTVAAPTQCTSLNGTTQYYSKTSPAGMTFTNNFVVSAWIKLSSYPAAAGYVASRYNGTSGWEFYIDSSGRVLLSGKNAASANFSQVLSYQSVPLNKWVHVAAQLDMATFTATPTTSYVMIDGVDVPTSVSRGGTNPTALVQAGNLEIGSGNGGGGAFPGKLAQVAIYSAKVTEATILASMHQTLAGTETSLISAYSFNNSINDLNANANNLTANGSAVATNADSPFGGQADGTISSTLDYAIVTKTAFSTNTTLTVQVPEGCTIPTSGGVSAVSYSTQKIPYLFPGSRAKWQLISMYKTTVSQASPVQNTWYNIGSSQIITPVGEWEFRYFWDGQSSSAGGPQSVHTTLSTANNTESERNWTSMLSGNSVVNVTGTMSGSGQISNASATTYYINMKTHDASIASISFDALNYAACFVQVELTLL